MRKLVAGNFSGAYIVGEDLFGAGGDREKIRAALQKLSFLVVQDTRLTETAKLAHVVLPATHFGEKDGTYTNRRGRVQKLNAAVIPPEGALQDCDIFLRLLDAAGESNSYASTAAIFAALAWEIPSYKGLDYDSIGDQGIELGSGRVERHDR
jgi:predicted molibdopterin-dependent oxidoreductase YjgC